MNSILVHALTLFVTFGVAIHHTIHFLDLAIIITLKVSNPHGNDLLHMSLLLVWCMHLHGALINPQQVFGVVAGDFIVFVLLLIVISFRDVYLDFTFIVSWGFFVFLLLFVVISFLDIYLVFTFSGSVCKKAN